MSSLYGLDAPLADLAHKFGVDPAPDLATPSTVRPGEQGLIVSGVSGWSIHVRKWGFRGPAVHLGNVFLAVVGLIFSFEAPAEVLVEQPTDVTDVRSISYVDKSPPRGNVGITLWGSHYQLQPTGDHTLDSYTGFSPPDPRRNYQLSVDPSLPGATAIQARGGEIGINIHSASIAANLVGRSNLGTIVLGANLLTPARPFASGKKAKYSFDVNVQRAEQTNRGVSQLVAYYSLRDKIHNQSFWFGLMVFDSRGWRYQRSQGFEGVMWDKGTNQPIVHATAGHASNLLDRLSPTAAFGGQPFSAKRSYAFVIGASQVRAAISMVKSRYPELAEKFSDDPSDYEIRHINLNPEIYAPEGSLAQVGMSVINWRLELVP